MPQTGNGPGVVAGGLHIGHWPDFFTTAARVAAGEADVQGVRKIGLERAAVVAALAGRRVEQCHLSGHLHAPKRGVILNPGHAGTRVRGQRHDDGLEVDQQRIGAGVVGAQRFTVKVSRVGSRHGKSAVVEHDVAINALDAQALHPTQQQPEFFHHQLGVTLALDDQIALEHAMSYLAFNPHRGVPGKVRAEHVQCGRCGQQFHDRGRVHQHIRVPAQAWRRLAIGINHPHADCVQRNFGAVERVYDRVWQGLRLHAGLNQQCASQPGPSFEELLHRQIMRVNRCRL
ncbi:hypothetical protein GALL_466600 [mine drainage metagenome]|uniref:Uncharacterized protein n=1 Tax=mine drainage metagenome TaxID=410659 RepID=A0A1J5PVC5_9ZZZZ